MRSAETASKTIKAIETVYNGYRFRSRLEARWAVFFDVLGIEYQYEPEGYDLFGTWYLPDFWLPELSHWVEIKPANVTADDHERCHDLFIMTEQKVLLLAGSPWPDEYKIFPKPSWTYKTEQIPPLEFAQCANCHSLWMGFEGFGALHIGGGQPTDRPCDETGETIVSIHGGSLEKAFKSARQARFEHGETPHIR